MFSLSNNTMNKMTEDNPLLAMMQTAFANDNESVKKTTEAWLKALPDGPANSASNLAAHPMAAFAASSAVGLGMYTQMVGTMLGAMTGAMEAAEKMKDATETSQAPFGMLFNPLTFEWSDVNSADPAPSETKKPKKNTATKTKNVEEKTAANKSKLVAQPVSEPAKPAEMPSPEPVTMPEANIAKLETPAQPVPSEAEPKALDLKPAAPEIMPEDFKKPKKLEKPDTPDDLKLISGIGPKLEQVLNGMGIWTYAQIAEWSAEEIAYVDDFLQFKGRIERDEWLKQAAELKKA